jgi:hypothetical protein
MLPRLRQVIQDPQRDPEDVYQTMRPYHEYMREMPMIPADLPELEALGRLILEQGGRGQKEVQEVLLRLVGATAEPESVPFLLEMWRYTRRGDMLGPFRRQLALWGLARVALFHGEPKAYAALLEGLDDHQAEVRWRVANLIIDAYLGAKREVPQEVIDKLRQMAESDPDDYARRTAKRFLREPWAQDR